MSISSLIEIGAAGYKSRPSRSLSVSPLPLVAAMVVLIMGFVGGGVIASTYAGADQRSAARTPVFASEGQNGYLLYLEVHDSLVETTEDVSIIYLVPTAPDAPLPPGLDKWPDEGEVYLSPALLKAAKDEGIEERYGRVIGLISEEGLIGPTEKIAYIYPTAKSLDTAYMQSVVGFGDSNYEGIGDMQNRQPLALFLIAYSFTIGAGVAFFLGIALRSGAGQRRAENAILYTLGFSLFERTAWQLGKLWRSLLVGFLFGSLLSLPWFFFDIRIPGKNFVVLSSDIRAGAVAIVIGTILASLGYVFVLIGAAVKSPKDTRANSPRERVDAYSTVKVLTCTFSIPVSILLMLWLNGSGATWLIYSYFLTFLVVLATIRDLLGFVVHRTARRIRAVGVQRNDPAKVLGGAGLEAGGRLVVSLSVVFVTTLIIASQVFLFVVARGETNREALSAHSLLRGEVVELVGMQGSNPENKGDMLAAINSGGYESLAYLITEMTDDQGNFESHLNQVGEESDMPCAGNAESDRKLDDYLHFRFGTIQIDECRTISPSDIRKIDSLGNEGEGVGQTYVIISTNEAPLDLAGIKKNVADNVAPMWRVDTPGAGDYGGVLVSARHAGWVSWLGLISLGIILVGIIVTLADDTLYFVRRIAPLTVLTNSPHIIYGLAFIRIGVPILAGVGVGVGISAMLASASALSMAGSALSVVPFILGACFMALVLGFIGWILVVISGKYIFDSWKVGQSDFRD